MAGVANPVVSLTISTPSGPQPINFLLDTGSQLSIIDYDKIKDSGLKLMETSLNLNSLSIKNRISGYDSSTKILLPSARYEALKFFAIPNFKIQFNCSGISSVLSSLGQKQLLSLSTCVPDYFDDTLIINGILGADFISKLRVFQFCEVGGGR